MTWTCSVAAITALLGWMPERGSVVDVPESRLVRHSRVDVFMAKRCARKHGIEYRIVKG